MSVQAIGQALRREEDPRLLRGRGRYADDVHLPREAPRLGAGGAGLDALSHDRRIG